MKGRIVDNWGIAVAALFSLALIVGAFVLARGFESPAAAQASEETALLQAIATKDTDVDGLPDWEEGLYGTDPKNSDTSHLGMTDGEAVAKGLIVPKASSDIATPTSSTVPGLDPSLPPPPAPGTLTAAFAQKFFTLFLVAKEAAGGADLSETQLNDVTNEAIRSLSATVKISPDFKTKRDLTVSGSGADALIAFAVNSEAILSKKSSTATTSEIKYLKRVLENHDTDALAQIASIAKTYRDTATGLAVLPVPSELADGDLVFINAMMRLGQIINDLTAVESDPLTAMLALNQYAQAVQDLASATLNIGNVYLAANVSLPQGAPGEKVVTLVEKFANDQKTAAKKP